jgi:hypothetical protein
MNSRVKFTALLGAAVCALASTVGQASDLLVVDRLSASVYRYSSSGSFLNVVVNDTVNLQAPDGVAVSPDLTKLFVASAQNNSVIRYDYNATLGTATNPITFANDSDGLSFPNALKFSQDGSKLYVTNLNGTGVTQLNAADGTVAGPPLLGNFQFGASYSGIDYAPDGRLIVGIYADFATFQGSALISNAAGTALDSFVPASNDLAFTAGVMVHGNDLYLSTNAPPTATPPFGSGTIYRFNATTGAPDASFTPVTGLAYPQGMIPAPDGNGFLLGILGAANGEGRIDRYAYDGTYMGLYAASGNGINAFKEATAFTVVSIPEPASAGLIGIALL